jgi:hypothetical protein
MPRQGKLGTPGTLENAASVLSGVLIDGKPCLPLKKFTLEAGYGVNISPSGRQIGIIVKREISVFSELPDGSRKATARGKPFELTVAPLARDKDVYVQIDYFESVFPARFTWDAKAHLVTVQLPNSKVLKIPVKPPA